MASRILFSALVAWFAMEIGATISSAHEGPEYSLDRPDMITHPYRHVPMFSPSAILPSSPKYFRPGIGYRVTDEANTFISPYWEYYSFGRRNPGFYNDRDDIYWTNAYGGPWYYPGSSVNTQSRHWPGW